MTRAYPHAELNCFPTDELNERRSVLPTPRRTALHAQRAGKSVLLLYEECQTIVKRILDNESGDLEIKRRRVKRASKIGKNAAR